MNIVYPINGRNERMGSLFTTPKHLLHYLNKPLILQSIENVKLKFTTCNIIIITNDRYYKELRELLPDDVRIELIGETSSQIETIQTITSKLSGPVMFIDCDILPIEITEFNQNYNTVFVFQNNTKLLNYSNFKSDVHNNILKCNEKQKIYKYAGSGMYYFNDVNVFNTYSNSCKNISECINLMLLDNIQCKVNTDSNIKRFGTLQDIYIDNFSFREHNQKDLSTGFTKNKVFKERNNVVKIGDSVQSEYIWYNSYKNKKQIPQIISYESDKLIMKFIHRDTDLNLDDIFDVIDIYKQYDKLNNLTFYSYIENIKNHLNKNINIPNGSILLQHLSKLDITPTFCHGDLSVMNIIPTINGIKLIDPLYSIQKFGSYEIDIAKLCFSYKFYKNDSASFNYIKNKSNIYYLDILIASEAVRVASYKSEYSFIAENLINEI